MPGLNTTKSASLNAAATLTLDVPVGGLEILHVITQVGPTATAAGDNVTNVVTYLVNSGAGSTPVLDAEPAPLFTTKVNTLVGSKAWQHQQYNVKGLDLVQVQLTNNNVGALPAQIDVFGA